jgi:hypothetical protein
MLTKTEVQANLHSLVNEYLARKDMQKLLEPTASEVLTQYELLQAIKQHMLMLNAPFNLKNILKLQLM